MTVIAQDAHLTAGAWAACDESEIFMLNDIRESALISGVVF